MFSILTSILIRSFYQCHSETPTSIAWAQSTSQSNQRRVTRDILVLFIYSPQVILVPKGTVRRMESHFCRQPSNCRSSGCQQRQGQGQLSQPLGGSMSWKSSGAMSQLCPLAIPARLQTSPPSLCIRREHGFSPKRYLPLADRRTVYLVSSPRVRSC